MRKLLLFAAMAAFTFTSIHAQTETEAETLSDKLYVPIMQATQSKDWAQVQSLVEQIIAAGEDISDYEVIYAEALGENGLVSQGISRLEAYLPDHPRDYQGYYVLGELYADNMQRDRAAEAYDKSGEIAPNYARPYVSLGRLMATSDKPRAIDAYNKAIRIFLQAQRPDAAIQIGLEAMNVDKTNMRLLLLMGDALTEANMPDNALAFYAEVMSQAPKAEDNSVNIEAAVEANYNIAMIYYKKKEYKESMKFLEKMYKSEPLLSTDAKAYAMMLALGAADKTRMGDQKGVNRLLDKAKKYDPEGYLEFYNALLSLTE